MNRFVMVVSIVSFSLPTLASSPLPLRTVSTQSGCANFSGDWRDGLCTDPDGTTHHFGSLRLEQTGCFELSMPGLIATIGGTASNQQSYSGTSKLSVSAVDWNSNRSELRITQTYLHRFDGSPTATEADVLTTSLSLERGLLVAKVTSLGNPSKNTKCIYKK